MTNSPAYILDASAVLSLFYNERGAEVVERLLDANHCAMSTVNYSEVLAKVAERGVDESEIIDVLATASVSLVPLDEPTARMAARLRMPTKALGLSLGDRACLATASMLKVPVATADSAWMKAVPGLTVILIR